MKIICKVHSGLCNRLIPFITSMNLAKDLNSEYYLYWDDECQDLLYKYKGEKTKYNHLFELMDNINYINNEQFNKFLNCNDSKLIINFNTEFKYNKKDLLNYECIIFNNYYYPIYLENDLITFKNYSENFNFNQSWHQKINTTFNNIKLKNILSNKIIKFNNSELIGIHLRHNETKWAERNNVNEYNYLKILIKKMYDEIKINKNIKFFISTSNKNLLIKLESIFKDRISYFKDRFGNPKTDYFYNNNSENDFCTLNKNLNGLVDLILLSKCYKIYCKKSSSFSICAHLINNKSKLIIL